MVNEIMLFRNNEVEVFELNDVIYFNPRHVSACLEVEFKTTQNNMSLMNDKQVNLLTNNSISHLTGFRKLHNTGENFLTESGVYKLIFKSRKPEAEAFQDWVTDEVLPSIRKTGKYTVNSSFNNRKENFEMELIGIGHTAEILNISKIGRIQLIHNVHKNNAVSTKSLPLNEEDVRVSFSATELLSRNNCDLKIIAFNELMINKGFLIVNERRSIGKTKKYFKSLVGEGLKYGKNDINIKSHLETQPHYYEDVFMELYELLVN